MYDVAHDAYLPSSDEADVRTPGAPAWLSRWVKSYLRACGVRDHAATQFVIGVVADDAPTDPRSLVIRIHSALAHHGTHVAAPPMLPALLPAELPGAMPSHALSPVWSTSEPSKITSSPAKVGMAGGAFVVLLMGIFDHGP
jgi:hypothetical protein